MNFAGYFFLLGSLLANTTLAQPPSLPVTTRYTTENALGALTFSAPMCARSVQGETNRIFIAERGGTIQAVTDLSGTPAKQSYLALTSLLSAGETLRADGENGLLSLAFDPNFATNGTFYVYFSIDVSGTLYQRLHQVSVNSPGANTATIFSHKPLLTVLDRATNHNGGDLHFGADGFLYLSLGDEGFGGDGFDNARFINHRNDASVQRTGFWGQLLRIAVEADPKAQPGVFPANTIMPNAHVQNSTAFPSALHGNYRIPADNPFIGYTLWHSITIDPATVRTEIYATGLRNPFRWSFDPPTGRIFIGDVGQNSYEEINLVSKGDDLGWSWREGLHQYPSPPAPTTPPTAPGPGDPPGTGFSRRDPIYEYDHTTTTATVYGQSVTGGMVYRGNRLPELKGAYLFADYVSGFIVALREQADGTWTATRLATDNGIVDFGTDPRNGDLIFCDLGAGTVKRLARAGSDFNADGISDLLFQHTAGYLAAWTLNGSGVVSSGIPIYNGAGLADWRLAGTADVNGDGIPDLLLQHTDGYIVAWTMNGSGAITGGISIYTGTGLAGWRLAGVADVNGDGIPDLIFQHTLGYLAAWTLNGSGVVTSGISIYSGAGLAGWLLQ